jgi:hypothetical protein
MVPLIVMGKKEFDLVKARIDAMRAVMKETGVKLTIRSAP